MKIIVTLILVVGFLLDPHYSPADEGVMLDHVLAPFRHANIWHLAGNIFCLWMLHLNRTTTPSQQNPSKIPLYTPKECLGEPFRRILQGMAIAFICGFLRWKSPTIGFSGVLFAMVGVMWGECLAGGHGTNVKKVLNRFMTRCMPWAVVGMIIPHIDGMLHTACLLCGLFYGYLARSRR